MLSYLRISSFRGGGGDMAKDFVFKQEFIDISIAVIGIDRGLIPDFVQYKKLF